MNECVSEQVKQQLGLCEGLSGGGGWEPSLSDRLHCNRLTS